MRQSNIVLTVWTVCSKLLNPMWWCCCKWARSQRENCELNEWRRKRGGKKKNTLLSTSAYEGVNKLCILALYLNFWLVSWDESHSLTCSSPSQSLCWAGSWGTNGSACWEKDYETRSETVVGGGPVKGCPDLALPPPFDRPQRGRVKGSDVEWWPSPQSPPLQLAFFYPIVA